ncbi:MAG: serine protease [Clostridia bacterium]|nr:serine protease [Clostridia bacterium]
MKKFFSMLIIAAMALTLSVGVSAATVNKVNLGNGVCGIVVMGTVTGNGSSCENLPCLDLECILGGQCDNSSCGDEEVVPPTEDNDTPTDSPEAIPPTEDNDTPIVTPPVEDNDAPSGDSGVTAPEEDTNTPENESGLNEYEKEVIRLVNEIRAEHGLSALVADEELSRVARIKSQDMKDNNYFSHTSPTYGSPFEMMKKFGISYRTAGENIARGQGTPQAVVNGWMNSSGHRANILNASYNRIGVGYVAEGNYWTQMFVGR